MSRRPRKRPTMAEHFAARTSLARTYMDDGAFFTAANILSKLSADLTERALAVNEALEQEMAR